MIRSEDADPLCSSCGSKGCVNCSHWEPAEEPVNGIDCTNWIRSGS